MEAVLQLPTPIRYTNPVHADERTGPWASVAEACAQVEPAVRTVGLLVMITGLGYHWWPGPGLEDGDLVPYLPTAPPPTTGGGAGQRGTYFELPGLYSAANRVHALPAGTKDIDLHFGSGRTLQPAADYTLDTSADPPTVTVTASLPMFEGEALWGRTYRTSSRTYYELPTAYGPGYPPAELPAGTADVEVYFTSGRPLQPTRDYAYDVATRTLTLLADPAMFGGETLWLWLYS
ncbi:hypothetical protein [Hymenobacter glacieicola]|uniref:Uncharacterized protein n=1 Tax=Hymenobacter glacieicola TaxID=1562124 RepID=A0ABQ1WKP1_9BACT|nr:hypothetical protein [Hymenobacter glacieicola]GGG34267.1 hypothetical protein GCM10011378_08350 [Hymenobacter glacieicola]